MSQPFNNQPGSDPLSARSSTQPQQRTSLAAPSPRDAGGSGSSEGSSDNDSYLHHSHVPSSSSSSGFDQPRQAHHQHLHQGSSESGTPYGWTGQPGHIPRSSTYDSTGGFPRSSTYGTALAGGGGGVTPSGSIGTALSQFGRPSTSNTRESFSSDALLSGGPGPAYASGLPGLQQQETRPMSPDGDRYPAMPSVPYRYSTASGSSGSLMSPLNYENSAAAYAAAGTPRSGGSHSRSETNSALLWDKENAEADDYLHDPDPEVDRRLDKQWGTGFNVRGITNVGMTFLVCCVLVGLFAFWPIYRYVIKGGFPGPDQNVDGYNIGGINGSGQVPDIPGLPNLIDNDTPDDALTRTGWDGDQYSLVFSDEFNTDGRTFWPGDDPFWEAVDLHYWATTDLEWYDPDAMVTEGGNLVITLSEEPIHDLNFRSGMVQSWNKFCFTGGYVEVRASLPGTPTAMGYWPGAWTLANLVRAGYGATADGVWPYSYDSCDVGTLPNQTWPNGTDPVAAKESGSRDYGGELSYLNGQRLSACTCPGEEHPGPSNNVGRSGAEIDILEGQVDSTGVGSASQSIQIAPMDAGYLWGNTTPDTIIYDEDITFQNIWQGSVNQESLSVITLTDAVSYEGAGYQTYGFEYQPGPDGYITWYYNGNPTWTMQASAIGPDPETQIAQRLVSEEPMYLILNLALSTKFQYPEWAKLEFPGHYMIDYIRVYQKGTPNIGCDPSSHPTAQYIQDHIEAYTNPNMTVWEQTPYDWPRNRLSAEGCA